VIVVEGECSLVAAILAANKDAPVDGCAAGSGHDEIQLTGDVEIRSVDHQADGSNGLPPITSAITVNGRGFGIARAEDVPRFRLFRVAGGLLELMDVEVRNGDSPCSFDCFLGGGGVFNSEGTLVVTRSSVVDNTGEPGSGIAVDQGTTIVADSLIAGNVGGPAILNSRGQVTVRNSSISGNSSGVNSYGGAANFLLLNSTVTDSTDSGMSNSRGGTLNVSHSTVSGNAGPGPAIANREGVLTILNSTISGNEEGVLNGKQYDYALTYVVNSTITANQEFGIDNYCPGFGCDPTEIRLILRSSIVADNIGPDCSSNGEFEAIGVNFDSDDSCLDAEFISGLDPNLADNGGPTLTHALLPGSPAIDAAGDCGLTIDQRGFGRVDGSCDSGAYEAGAVDSGPVLALTGSCPGPVALDLTAATPEGSAVIVAGQGPGVSIVPVGVCTGTELGVESAQLVRGFVTDGTGGQTLDFDAPSALCGVSIQALDLSSCLVSNVLAIDR